MPAVLEVVFERLARPKIRSSQPPSPLGDDLPPLIDLVARPSLDENVAPSMCALTLGSSATRNARATPEEARQPRRRDRRRSAPAAGEASSSSKSRLIPRTSAIAPPDPSHGRSADCLSREDAIRAKPQLPPPACFHASKRGRPPATHALAGRRDSARAAVTRPLRRQRARGGPPVRLPPLDDDSPEAPRRRRRTRPTLGAEGTEPDSAGRASGMPRRAGRGSTTERATRRRVARREGHAAEAGAHPRWQLPKRSVRDWRWRLRGAAPPEDGASAPTRSSRRR